jgi:hypothetical protein
MKAEPVFASWGLKREYRRRVPPPNAFFSENMQWFMASLPLQSPLNNASKFNSRPQSLGALEAVNFSLNDTHTSSL